MGYAEVKKIYGKERLDYFVMVISYLMDIGFRNAAEITDKDIEEVEGNGLMTKNFCQELMKSAREIAKCCEPSELIQLCQAEDIFDVRFSAGKINRYRLEAMLENALCYMFEQEMSEEEIAEYIGADDDEMEMLGWELEEEEDE